MNGSEALNEGLVGYLYRWMRNFGIGITLTGAVWLGLDLYHASQDGRALATVQGIEVMCVLQADSLIEAETEVECGDVEATKAALPNVTFTVREVTYAKVAYQSDIGADYTAKIAVADLGAIDVHSSASVAIQYDRNDPSDARAVAGLGSMLSSGLLFVFGLFVLAGVVVVRRMANYRSDVGAEVEALKAAHTQRSQPAAFGRR